MRANWAILVSIVAVTMTAVLVGAGEEAPTKVPSVPENWRVVYEQNFDALEESEKWAGADGWKVTIGANVDAVVAIGREYASGEGKGLLLKNTRTVEKPPLSWVNIGRDLPAVTGAPVFRVAFDYLVPTAKDPDNGRVDFGIQEAGTGQLLFVSFASGISFIFDEYKEDDKVKADYASTPARAGEWNHLEIIVDQNQNKFQVQVNGKPVACKGAEWANFRYRKQASPQKAKSVYFSTANGWASSRRHIDNFVVSIAAEAKGQTPPAK